jgi:hypothetical protein
LSGSNEINTKIAEYEKSDDFNKSVKLTEDLLGKIENEDDIYPYFEKGLEKFEEKYRFEDLVPTGEDSANLRMVRGRDIKEFLKKYLGIIKKKICVRNGFIHSVFRGGSEQAIKMALGSVLATLALPPLAGFFIGPIIAYIMNKGLEKFCGWSS